MMRACRLDNTVIESQRAAVEHSAASAILLKHPWIMRNHDQGGTITPRHQFILTPLTKTQIANRCHFIHDIAIEVYGKANAKSET